MRFKRRLAAEVKPDLVPMIDVVFQLVIFFMVSSTFLQTPGIAITLPESSSAEAVRMTSLVVTVVSEDELYLNRERHSLESLAAALSSIDGGQRAEIGSVVVEGDAGVPYNLLVEVLDVLRINSFGGVSLRVRQAAE